MPIEVRVISTDSRATESQIYDGETERMLGDKEQAIAVQLNDLLSAVQSTIASTVEAESDLEIEVSGTVTLKAEAGVQYLFFNVGGSRQSDATLKVTLKTKVGPA